MAEAKEEHFKSEVVTRIIKISDRLGKKRTDKKSVMIWVGLGEARLVVFRGNNKQILYK